jgi:hypothetical protein
VTSSYNRELDRSWFGYIADVSGHCSIHCQTRKHCSRPNPRQKRRQRRHCRHDDTK